MGFNGVRMHQKVEDPRFYYHADRMGLLVWGEIGSAYIYSPEYAKTFYQEWVDCVLRDYNHPCIVVWVPLNESWGVQEIWKDPMQQAHSMAAYHITKSLDRTRPVVDNDGWEHTCGDLLTIHDYEGNASVLLERYMEMERILKYRPGGKDLFAYGYGYVERPVIVSEYGGVRFAQEGTAGVIPAITTPTTTCSMLLRSQLRFFGRRMFRGTAIPSCAMWKANKTDC